MSIEVFCPSRGRPAAARELLVSFNGTVAGPGLRQTPSGAMGGAGDLLPAASMGNPEAVKLIFLLDDDDPTAMDYPQPNLIGPSDGDPVIPSNRAALASTADIIGWTGDDTRFKTMNWDLEVRNALRKPGVFWAWDGHDKPWPSTFFVSREIVQAVGYLIKPGFKRSFWDTAWIDLAGAAGVARVSTRVMFYHDNSVHEGVNEAILRADETLYQRWREGDIRGDAQKIRNVIDLAHFFPKDLISV